MDELESFIEKDFEERDILVDWIRLWDPQRDNFPAAYKNPSAPKTNLSESYNSKYVRVNEINLKLLDAAKLDTAEALKY